jgi:hypothetical protein
MAIYKGDWQVMSRCDECKRHSNTVMVGDTVVTGCCPKCGSTKATQVVGRFILKTQFMVPPERTGVEWRDGVSN